LNSSRPISITKVLRDIARCRAAGGQTNLSSSKIDMIANIPVLSIKFIADPEKR
jgi:hypothetical protein